MKELKWVDKIITGMNSPDNSGYAIVNNGVVESFPVPREFNKEIADLFSRIAEGERAIEAMKTISANVHNFDDNDDLINICIDWQLG